VAESHLGVVDDGGQHIIEFVSSRACQFPQSSQLLRLGQLLLEKLDLLLGTHGYLSAVHVCPLLLPVQFETRSPQRHRKIDQLRSFTAVAPAHLSCAIDMS